jgi:hypothetical protein
MDTTHQENAADKEVEPSFRFKRNESGSRADST